MATITIGSTAGQRPYLQLNVWESSTNVGANQSTVSFSLILKRPSRISSSASKSWSASIDGKTFSGSGSIGGSGDKTLLTGSKVVGHNTDGSKSIGFSASASLNITWSGQWLGTISGSGSMGLTKIPRYLTEMSVWISSKTETSVTWSWKTKENVSNVSYKLSTSSNWIYPGGTGTSGSFTVSNLGVGSVQNINISLQRNDSKLWSYSGDKECNTYNWPYVQSGTNFVIGDALKLNVYNPLNRSYTLNVYASNGNVIGGYNGSGTVLNGFNDTNSIDLMYKNCANRSDTYHVTINYDGHVSTYDKGNTYSADKAVPVIGNVEVSDTKTFNGIHKEATELIHGRSAIQTTVASVSAQKYAKLRKITVSYDGTEKSKSWTGDTISDSNIAFDFTTSNSNEVTITVEDSRGMKTTRKIQLSFLQFAMPSLTLTAERGIYDAVYKTWKSDANHGTYAKCTLGGSTDSHLDIDSSKSVIKINNTNTSISSFGDMYIGGGNLLYTSGYHIEATLFDALGQGATAVADIASGSRIMTILKDEGIAFGGMAEEGKFKIYDSLQFEGCIFPVGYIVLSMVDENPAKWFGGIWEKIEGRFLLGASSAYPVGSTGGEATHTLTVNEMPKHQHRIWTKAASSGTGNYYSYVTEMVKGVYYGTDASQNQVEATGEGQPHNNMPPYIAVYMWQRTA